MCSSEVATSDEHVLVRQLLYLMDMVKNGIQQQNQRLPFVLTTYISKAAQQMLKPGVCVTLNELVLDLSFNPQYLLTHVSAHYCTNGLLTFTSSFLFPQRTTCTWC